MSNNQIFDNKIIGNQPLKWIKRHNETPIKNKNIGTLTLTDKKVWN